MSAQVVDPASFPRHVLTRTIVIEDLKILYVPLHKALSTSILWVLARAAGVPASRLETSTGDAVTAALTVHDTVRWDTRLRFDGHHTEEIQRILDADDWFRFTVTRHPLRRLWSAWQSKVLLREPQFVERFGEMEWFPPMPNTAEEIIASFNRFVAAMIDATTPAEGGPTLTEDRFNSHWAPQTVLLGAMRAHLNHVGTTDDAAATLDLLSKHLAEQGAPAVELPHENRAFLPFDPALIDPELCPGLDELFSADYAAFDYSPIESVSGEARASRLQAWRESAEHDVNTVRAIAARNERIGAFVNAQRHLVDIQRANDDLRSENAKLRDALVAAKADRTLALSAASETARSLAARERDS